MNYTKSVEKWGVFEFYSEGTTAGNPFLERGITALFESDSERKTVNGFYDGNGIYKVRFMPSFEEEYHFTVCGNFSDRKYEGTFSVTPPSENNHGCVKVHNKYHFQYSDGTPYYPVGTTCYVWNLQSDDLIAQTLETLRIPRSTRYVSAYFLKATATIHVSRAPIHTRVLRLTEVLSQRTMCGATVRTPRATTGILRGLTPSIFSILNTVSASFKSWVLRQILSSFTRMTAGASQQ